MNPIVIQKPKIQKAELVENLSIDTCFFNAEDQTYAILMDVQTLECKIACFSKLHYPYIVNNLARSLKIGKITQPQTTLDLIQSYIMEGESNDE